MKVWWLRPLVRLLAALVLPFAVPAIITALIWALPGDPAEIICPPERCGGTEVLAARWNLDQGPWHFYVNWLSSAMQGDFGNSWRVLQGVTVRSLLEESVPTTTLLMALGMLPIVLGSIGAATGRLPARVDPALSAFGVVPAVIFSLFFAALIELRYGAESFDEHARMVRLGVGAVVLGLSDGALGAAVAGVRALFSAEEKQRYVGVAVLRGEGVLANMLPNVSPALAGQLRARLVHLLSGTVVVEVVLRIDGVGDLLWQGTLLQDFGVVLAAAGGFAFFSAFMLFFQAVVEILVSLHVRRAPVLPLAPG